MRGNKILGSERNVFEGTIEKLLISLFAGLSKDKPLNSRRKVELYLPVMNRTAG